MHLQFLGTSGSSITSTRSSPSILIDEDLLLDVGEGTTQKLLQIDKFKSIKKILISHLHVDHFIGLFSLLWKKWLTGSRTPLKIYGPPEIDSTIPQILALGNTPTDAFSFQIQYIPLDPADSIIKIDEISTTRVLHPAYTLGFRVDRDKSICYSSDTAPLDRMISLAKNCDVLIHDSSYPSQFAEVAHKYHHSTPRDAATIASKAGVKKLVLFHILGEIADYTSFAQEARSIFGGEVILAQDMGQLDF